MDSLITFIQNQLNTEFRSLNKYTETYTVTYNPEKHILFLRPSGELSDESLYKKLSNKVSINIFHDYIDHILKMYIKNLLSTEVVVYENGDIGIILRVSLNPEVGVSLEDVPMETYVEVVKNLDIGSIDSLCLTDKTLSSICANQKFWKELLRVKYPNLFYLTSIQYDYRKIYTAKSYLKDTRIVLREYLRKEEVSGKINDDMLEYIKYRYRKHNSKLIENTRCKLLIKFIIYNTKDYEFFKEVSGRCPLSISDIRKLIGVNVDKIKNTTMKNIVADLIMDIIDNNPQTVTMLGSLVKILSEQQISKILVSPKLSDENKTNIIKLLIELDNSITFDKLMRYISYYKTDIDNVFISRILYTPIFTENYDIIKGLIISYPEYMTAEKIYESIKDELSQFSPEFLAFIFNLDIMRKRYLKE